MNRTNRFIDLFVLLTLCKFLGISGAIWAQTDSIRQFSLDSVGIYASPLRENVVGERTKHWDSLTLNNYQYTHLADILARESGVFIKSYGMGSLATSAVRGGSASHTAVLWNGFPVQSPMLGQLDLSLLPVNFIDELQLQYGGNSAAWGSGAIGGTISINNRPDFGGGLAISTGSTIGSFGQEFYQLKTQYSREKFSYTTRLFYQQAKNNFSYTVRPDLPKRTQSHANLLKSGLLQEAYWKIAQRHQIGLQLWWQETEREMPPTSTQSRSGAFQADDALRTGLHWQYADNQVLLKARAGFFKEKLNYNDELIGLNSRSRFSTFIGEIESQWKRNERQQFQGGINYTWTKAHSDGYQDPPTQQRIAFWGSFRQRINRWQLQLSGRQGWVDNQMLPIVPSLGIEGKLTNWLKLRTKISRNYRMPTLNDRFWQPGGNPDLLAEYGWSEELGLEGKWNISNHLLKYSVTGFNRNIHNWILWSIREGQSFWSANNIAEVWSRGIEQRSSWELSTHSWHFKVNGAYDYILSTNQKDIQQPRIKAGDQLLYTPKYQAFGGVHIKWKELELAYQHRYTSSVQAINGPLDSYDIGNAHIRYAFHTKSFSAQSLFRIENIWDASYRIIERRPMPGRYYLIGLNIQWRQKIKS